VRPSGLDSARKGADLYFDGVGGAVSDTVMWQINFKPMLANGLTVQGYSPFHYAEHFGEATGDLLAWVTAGTSPPGNHRARIRRHPAGLRRHSALGYRTPADFAAACRCTHTPVNCEVN
jgi:hypothetical protein